MANTTPAIEPIVPAYRIRILSDDQLEKFKTNTFEILQEVGIHCPSERALKIYAEHGANVDFESKIVKMSPDVVLEALSHAPRYYTMGGRTEAFDLDLSKGVTYEATDGTGTTTIDYDTGEKRSSIKDDVAKSARIADYLSSVSFYWPMVSAQDHPATPSLHELDASFNNTLKHVQTPTVVEEVTTRYAIEMAKVIAGNEATMRARPPLSLLICTISPLAQDAESMDAALVAAKAGIPVGFMAMPNTGSTSPATIEGTISVGDAEMVSAMALIQMAYPGAPIYYSFMPGLTHPRTGAYLGHEATIYAVGVELAHMWGVPTLAGTFGGGATYPGWESTMGGGVASLLCALCGGETGSGMGLLKGSTLLYPEGLVLDAELYHNVRHNAGGVDTSSDKMALDVIKAVGQRGHYLGQRHTRDFMHKFDFSDVVYVPEKDGAYRDPIEVAREKTNWILENHHPEPLEPEKKAELDKILQKADAELGGK
ncbi:MAG: trimethylamine methyltransferase family protein [Anaerolineales bacterium]|nr:trimethylamine methyltransferase family protein [Chloroflexota bacterium]MBL6980069.1 trimethylamine methyltransferase family protein [Anaerolineales bacterium]